MSLRTPDPLSAFRRRGLGTRLGGVYNWQCAAVNATCGFKMRGCRCSPVGPCRAPDPLAEERERLRELRTSRAVNSELVWNTWPNRLVLRRSLHSENETNNLLKSGPAWPDQPDRQHRLCLKKDVDHFIPFSSQSKKTLQLIN